jgi:transglutaminase-like putative cysteine protease
MPRLSLVHRTTYRYRNPVALGEHRVMARPMEGFDQRLLSSTLHISPNPTELRTIHDLSGAAVTAARFEGRADQLDIVLEAELEVWPERCPHAQDDDSSLGRERFAYEAGDEQALSAFLALSPGPTESVVDDWSRRFLKPVGRTRLATFLSDMTHAIRAEVTYAQRLTGKAQDAVETLASRRGSCRDLAMLMVVAARRFGIASQFVSGYVYGPPGGGEPTGGGHTHAWMRAYLPAVGWCDFDPTNGIVGSRGLVRVAAVAQPRDATPLHGTWSGLASDFIGLDVDVAIRTLEPAEPQPIEAQGISHRRQ